MLVTHFMIKAQDVATCQESEHIVNALEAIMGRKISAVLILDTAGKPVGIVTKTDLVRAYQQGISLGERVGAIMSKDLKTILDTDNRDEAAKAFERNENHHAVVVNAHGVFVGLISSWDIATEVAKDSRAWPYFRTPDGKVAAAH